VEVPAAMSSLLLAPALGAIDPTCKDTPDWQNPYGKRCDDYRVLAYCAQGHVMRGQEWTVGADYKHPEQNCCVCGKGYVAPAPAQPKQPAASHTVEQPAAGGCVDAADWQNRHGASCAEYAQKHCAGGAFRPGQEWTGGEFFDYPERACCACGKDRAAAPCLDTPGWTNPFGAGCAEYAAEYCASAAFRPGSEWSGGEGYASPEANCCVCGKGANACVDTAGWANQFGADCPAMSEHCRDGAFLPGHEWSRGELFASPELNCCACGKSSAVAH